MLLHPKVQSADKMLQKSVWGGAQEVFRSVRAHLEQYTHYALAELVNKLTG